MIKAIANQFMTRGEGDSAAIFFQACDRGLEIVGSEFPGVKRVCGNECFEQILQL